MSNGNLKVTVDITSEICMFYAYGNKYNNYKEDSS